VEPLIAKACERGGDGETAEWVREQVTKGEGFLLVLMPDGVTVFERDGNTLHAVTLAGSGMVRRAAGLVEAWKEVATHIGCNRLTLKGRKGWSRVFAPFGFTLDSDGYLGADHGK
jgi:hypothetical protein